MLTKVEVLSIWYLIALQRHVLITYIYFAGVMREGFLISFAWKILFAAQLTRIHTDTHTPLKRAMPFSCLANHSSCTILLNGFSRTGYVCKMWSAKQIHSQSKHIVEQSGDRQVVLNCHREDHSVFFF